VRILYVGDPHVKVNNIKESQDLIDFIYKTAIMEKVDKIVFLGDLFHTHAVMRMEVINFWLRSFTILCSSTNPFEVIALVGNHDKCGNIENNYMHSLQSFQFHGSRLIVIENPEIVDGIGFMPYMRDHNKLIEAAKRMPKRCLVAHQTFTGATYENGFYAEDGIDPDLLPQEQIISGHIHKSQQVGKCFYPGTPKWDTISDANEDKGIWIIEHSSEGSIESKRFISTKDIVTPIYKYVIKEGDAESELTPNARNHLELHGKTAWITQMKKKYKGKASIKAKPTDRRIQKVGDEKSVTLIDYLEKSFKPIDGVSKEDINQYLRGLSK
jgi:DNA repair exonuclease SbcCD nuclease subunit